MPDITGLKELKRTLKQLKSKSKRRDDGSVIVGYTANYSLQVHENRKAQENREARNGVGQWKFLEQPARTMQKEMAAIVAKTAGRIGIIKSLLIAGLRLQRESQKLVPIDTGNLKASAFTALDKGGGDVTISSGPKNV